MNTCNTLQIKKYIYWCESIYPTPSHRCYEIILYCVFSNDRDVDILSTRIYVPGNDDLIIQLPEIFVPSFTVQDFMTIISIYKFFRHFRLLLKRHTDRAKVVYTSLSSRLSQFVRGPHKFCHNWISFFEDDGRFSDPKPPAEEEPY